MTVKAYNKKSHNKLEEDKKADGYQIYWCKGDEWTIPHNDYYSMPKDCYNDYVQLKKITKNSTTREEPTATKTGSIPSMTAQGPPPLKLTGDCPSIAKTRDI